MRIWETPSSSQQTLADRPRRAITGVPNGLAKESEEPRYGCLEGSGQSFKEFWSAALSLSEVQVDSDALCDFLYFPFLPAARGRTLLKGVVSITPGAEQVEPRGCVAASLDEAADVVEAGLRRRISAYCGLNIGVLATGGLDSAVVASVAAACSGGRLTLVHIRAGISSPLEIRLQGELANQLDASVLIIDELPAFDVQVLIEANRGVAFPTGGVFSHIWNHVAHVARENGIDVLLTGDGGNEIFGTDPSTAMDLLRGGRPIRAVAEIGRSRTAESGGLARGLLTEWQNACLQPATVADSKSQTNRWLGVHAGQLPAARRRRRIQIADLRSRGLTHREAVTKVGLSALKYSRALDTTGKTPFIAPLMDGGLMPRLSGGARSSSSGANPIAVGTRDKQVLRLIARRHLPETLSEAKKVGISNQNAIILRGADLSEARARLEGPAKWLGLDLDESYWRPCSLSVHTALQWGRILALASWATNAHSDWG